MDNPSRYLYITNDDYQDILEDLNIDLSEDGGLSKKQQIRTLDRAIGEMEADLVKRFTVPLQGSNKTPYSTAPYFARQKILSTIKAKIRTLIGQDLMKNIVIDTTEKYIDIKDKNYRVHIKDLLDHETPFGFNLQSFADDGSLIPVQKIGVARPDDSRSLEYNDEDFII